MKKKFVTFYTPKQVLTENIALSRTKSPLKPKLVVEALQEKIPDLKIKKFKPYKFEDFLIAHTEQYVNEVYNFNQPGIKTSADIPWSKQLVETLTYTNACLYNAIMHSIKHKDDLVLAPVAGFHHAQPRNGLGFCTFSGQVIASIKIFKLLGLRGCYLDLDGHFGNSIEDTRMFAPILNKAVPEGFNFNPNGKYSTPNYSTDYVKGVRNYLYNYLTDAFVNKKIDYVVWCHGADSHEDDDFSGQVNTDEWLECSTIFYEWVLFMETTHKIKVPVTLTLFGGYRQDDYNSVISLHLGDIITGINILTGSNIEHIVKYKSRNKRRY